MGTSAATQTEFATAINALFPNPDLAGVVVRPMTSPGGRPFTVAYIADLVEPSDLERLVLIPLAQGPVSVSPEALMRENRFPAAVLQCVADAGALSTGLLGGLIAVHVDGFPQALLVGTGQQVAPSTEFGPDLGANIAILHRQLPVPGLQIERISGESGNQCGLVYLDGVPDPKTLQKAREWSRQLRARPAAAAWWRPLLSMLRLPTAVETPSAAFAAEALRRGYIAVVADHQPYPLLAPTTLELLLASPRDADLPAPVRRAATMPRLAAALIGLTLNAFLAAITAYHHSLLPGPFLVALAASRGNLPFPIVMEVLLACVISDAFQVVALKSGGSRFTLGALIGIVLAYMTAMQVGLLSAVVGFASMLEAAARATLPNIALGRTVRIWRYLFIGAASALGVYGMTLLLVVMLAYLGDERALAHPVRLPPAGIQT